MSDSIPCLRLEGIRSQGYYSTQYISSKMMQVKKGLEGDCDPRAILGMAQAEQQMGTVPHTLPLDQTHNITAGSDILPNDINEPTSWSGLDNQTIAGTSDPAAETGVINCSECWKSYRGKSAYTSYLRHRRTDHSNTMYKCPHCGWRNRRTDNLAVHVRTMHPGAKVPKGREEWVEYQIPIVYPIS